MTSRSILLGILVSVLAAGACAPAAAPPPTGSATADHTSVPPDMSSPPSPSNSAAPTSSPTPSTPRATQVLPQGSASPAVQGSEPPEAVLAAVGSRRAVGRLGSYVFNATGSDAPWLPARALAELSAPPRAMLEMRLAGNVRIAEWQARIARAADEAGEHAAPLASGGSAQMPSRSVQLRGPARGDWVLMMEVTYPDGLGSAAYYWHLSVR